MSQAANIIRNCAVWRDAWNPPDRRPMHEWLQEHVHLTTGSETGPFSVRRSRWMIDVFGALQDLKIRRVNLRKAVKIGGTLVAELWLQWLLNNDPGNVSWTLQNDQEMEDHVKSRLWPLMENGCKVTRDLLPPVGPLRTTNRIFFGAFFVAFNAANQNSQQSKDIRYKINDEIWLPKWVPIYGQAIARTEAFARAGLSKIFNVSQAGTVGDIEDKTFLEGHQADLFVICPLCQKATPLAFEVTHPQDKEFRAGVVWEKDAKQSDGYFNVARAVETCRFRCEQCAHEQVEGEKMRAGWYKTQHFQPRNLQASPEVRSFHVESIVAKPLPDLVSQFCNASNASHRGFIDDLKLFMQQQRAVPWIEEQETIRLSETRADYVYADYAHAELWEGEDSRALTIDRQKDHFWAEIRAWKLTGDSRQLFFGRVNAIEEVRGLQKQFNVPDFRTFEDSGYDPNSVYNDCVRYGWIALRGEEKMKWKHEAKDEKKEYRFYSAAQRILQGEAHVYQINFSADDYKDMLAALLRGRGARWDLPRDVSQAYVQHQEAEQKMETRPGWFTWKKIGSRANHGKDTSNMQLVYANIKGYIKSESEIPKNQ